MFKITSEEKAWILKQRNKASATNEDMEIAQEIVDLLSKKEKDYNFFVAVFRKLPQVKFIRQVQGREKEIVLCYVRNGKIKFKALPYGHLLNYVQEYALEEGILIE